MYRVLEPKDILNSKDYRGLSNAELRRYKTMIEELRSTPYDGENYKKYKGERLRDYEKKHHLTDIKIYSVKLNNEIKNSKRLTYHLANIDGEEVIVITGVGNHKYNGQSYVTKKMKSDISKSDKIRPLSDKEEVFLRLTKMDPNE